MRVAVLGAGYAGLTLARRLEDALPDAVDLVVVEERETHLVQHEIHRAIRRPGLAEDLTIPLSELLDGATVMRGTVSDVDASAEVVAFANGDRLTYDYAAVCLGAETDFHGLPGVAEHATPLKRLRHAATIREDFLEVLDRGGNVVVGGAGLSGIQVAGELAALAREEGARDAVDLTLLEQLSHVAPEFPRRFQRAIRAELEARDVAVRTGAAVTGASADAVHVEGGEVAFDQLVWTGGIRGSDAVDSDRPRVRGDLRLDANTFALGDAARVVDADGAEVPASAQAAIAEARTAARNLARLVEHDRSDAGGFRPRLEPFRFEPRGWLVSVGDGAVAQVGPTVLTGRGAKALETTVGAGYLTRVGAVRNAADLVRDALGSAVRSS